MIGAEALTRVQAFFASKESDQIEAYVRTGMLYHKEIPFLYQVFKPTAVPLKVEKGGYKVVSGP